MKKVIHSSSRRESACSELARCLPMSREEMEQRGWDSLDILLVTGDAYVDHPSFGAALLGRWLEAKGFRVGIVAQPRWDNVDDVARMGRPGLFAGVTAGALDSMLAHYTAFRKKRSDDAYTPGGAAGARPNRACLVYTGLVRQAFPGLPVVLGGIEASLRRATHYDFWSDKLRRSILLDSKADLLVYGMGERAILEVAQRLGRTASEAARNEQPNAHDALWDIPGTAFADTVRNRWVGLGGKSDQSDLSDRSDSQGAFLAVPSHEAILENPVLLMESTLMLERQVHEGNRYAVQVSGDRRVVFAPPAAPLSTQELDTLYELPFTRRPNPSYDKPIPAADMIQFSVTSHRGCAGGCSFCSLALHQGRHIRSRSARSLRKEVELLTRHPDWTGSITDVGGPSANMWGARCAKNAGGRPFACGRASCLAPEQCPHFKDEQVELARLLKALTAVPGVKHVRIASGVRHDLALNEPGYVKTLLRDFVGGQLKLAPEHCCENVLGLMRKPSFETFDRFLTVFERESRQSGKEQYVIPYLMSAFPGCTDDDMRALARWLKVRGWKPQQVQCFIPTPGTVATAMYYSGKDQNGNAIRITRTDAERLRQHRILMPLSSVTPSVREKCSFSKPKGRPPKPATKQPRHPRRR